MMTKLPNTLLDDIKVADFSWAAAGPIMTKHLADLGATVVRVESRRHLDSTRITPPFPPGKHNINASGFFADFNTNKMSLSLNMSSPDSYGIARRLIEWSDVVVESFAPGIMRKWKLSYEDIAAWKPDVIMLSSTMLGQTGPDRQYAGYGNQGAAIAGLHYVTGWEDRIPAGPKGAYTDTMAPRYSTAALLAAMDYRRRTGKGQHIDLSQVEAAISGFMGVEILNYSANDVISKAKGNRSNEFSPHGVFRCAGNDRWIAIAVTSDEQWRRLCGLIQSDLPVFNPEMRADARRMHEEEIEAGITRWTSDQPAETLAERLQGVGIPASIVATAADLFDDPQLKSLSHFQELDHAELGRVAYNSAAYRIDGQTIQIGRAPPLLGEHNDYVLEKLLGYTREEIDAFSDNQVLE